MSNRLAFSFPVENKFFEFKREEYGVRVTEKYHGRRWGITFTRDEFVWWISELTLIWRSSVPRVRMHRGSGYVLTLRLCQNLNGRFFTLEKLHVNGGSVALRFPEGAGWGRVVDAAQRVGPFVKFMGSPFHSHPNAEQLSCRNCGSTDIAVMPAVSPVNGGRAVAAAPVLGGNGVGRSEIPGEDYGNVSVGDTSVLNMEVMGGVDRGNNSSTIRFGDFPVVIERHMHFNSAQQARVNRAPLQAARGIALQVGLFYFSPKRLKWLLALFLMCKLGF